MLNMLRLPFVSPNLLTPHFDNTLIITTLDKEGRVDTQNYQPLSEWNSGNRNPHLLANVYGNDLISILTNDLNLININEQGSLQLNCLITQDMHTTIMRLLGKIAEVLIVQECNSNPDANRRWARYARGGTRSSLYPDNFKAIGTGLKETKNLYSTKYNPNDTQRDIIWIDKNQPANELLQIKRNPSQCSGISAGLQIKVSTNGLQYVYKSGMDKAKRYEVPLIYFDLHDDYSKLTDTIYKERKDLQIGRDIIRGKDISPEIHDTLISYYFLIKAILEGSRSIESLISDPLLLNCFTRESLEQSESEPTIISV